MKLPNDLKQFFRPKTFLLINLGLILTAIEVFYFKKPNGFAIGGVSGISIIIAETIANTAAAEFFTMSMINLLLNGLLLVVGFAFLGRGFGLSTVYCSLVYSLEVVVLEKLSAGGQMALTTQIDNYPGFEEGIDGFTLGEKMQQNAERFGAVTELADVYSLNLSEKPRLP